MKKAILFVLFIVLTQNVAFSQEMIELSIGKKLSKSMAPKEKHNYSIELKKGQFALLNIEQQKMDLKIVAYGPDGEQIEEFDSLNGNNGDELVLLDGVIDGVYIIKVIPFEERRSGNYEIELIAINKNIVEHLNHILQTITERSNIPGFAASIVSKDTILYQNAKGYANIQSKTPYSPLTVNNIASISKTFIALSLMMMVEEGKLALDSPINEILHFEVKNPYFPNNPITVRHLATHTSTINDFPHYYEKSGVLLEKPPLELTAYPKEVQKTIEMAMTNKDMSMVEFAKKMLIKEGEWYKKKNFLKSAPGQEWFYSNVGACLAAHIIELVSGVPYDEFVETRVLEPLKLQSASWTEDAVDSSELASKYTHGTLLLPKYKIITYPDGQIYMNSQDFSRYLQLWLKGYEVEGGPISAYSFKEIMKIQYEEKQGRFKGTKNGLFWWQSKDGWMGHNGGDTGVVAIMKFNPETKLGITYMSNMEPTETDSSLIPFEKVLFALKRYSVFLK